MRVTGLDADGIAPLGVPKAVTKPVTAGVCVRLPVRGGVALVLTLAL